MTELCGEWSLPGLAPGAACRTAHGQPGVHRHCVFETAANAGYNGKHKSAFGRIDGYKWNGFDMQVNPQGQEKDSDSMWLFMALNTTFWLLYGVVVMLPDLFSAPDDTLQYGYGRVAMTSGMAVALVLREVMKLTWNRALWLRAVVIFGAVFTLTWPWTWLKIEATYWFYPWTNGYDLYVGLRYLNWYKYSFFVLVIWVISYLSIKYYRSAQRQTLRLHRAQSAAYLSQVKMLRYQLNPHFLFNTLNAISTLILDKHTESANTMLTRLAGFLRHSLDNDPLQKITLGAEIEALKWYLDIETARFNERLQVDWDIDAQAAQGLIPGMLLQPLVENSIKYAIAEHAHGGRIHVAAQVADGQLVIEVSDSGPGLSASPAEAPEFCGVGLRNTLERLQTLYPGVHRCEFINGDPNGLTVRICLPHETAEAASSSVRSHAA